MNKYQLEFWKYLTLIEDETDNKLETFSMENEKIKIKQNKNYNIKKYNFTIKGDAISSIEKIEGLKGKVWKKIGKTTFQLDFDNKVSKIKIHFINRIIDPIVFDIEMEDADKKAYDYELERKRKDYEKSVVDLEIATGVNLINVYFNGLTNKEYSYAVISLYRKDRKIGVYKLKDTNFLSIPNVASGEYGISIEQYNSDDELIYRSEENMKAFVNLSPQPVYRRH